MKNLFLILLLFDFSLCSYAQKRGEIINEKTQEPIPYVNIQVLGKKIGFSSTFDGVFSIESMPEDSLIFSAIGFKEKTILAKRIDKLVSLEPISYAIPEVTIESKEEKVLVIGRVKKQLFSLFYSAAEGSMMKGRFFPYDSSYEGLKFIKSIEFLTDSELDQAKFNIRLLKPDSVGTPGEPIHNKNLIIIAKAGYHKTKINLANLKLQFPKEGLFIIVEWLNLKENIHEESFKISNTGEEIKMKLIQPSFAAESHEKEERGWNNWGEWKVGKSIYDKPIQMKIILTN